MDPASQIYVEGSNTTNLVYYNIADNESRRQEALKRLFDHIAPGAFHNSADRYDPPKCHPKTRQAVIRKILDWASNASNMRRLMWIYGPAGAGKSAIMQTIAELWAETGALGASFFFFRSAPGRNTKTHLITTIAYQLALKVPGLGEHIALAIVNDPSIFSQNLSHQIRTLITNPMTTLSGTVLDARLYLVLIDGLDECSPEGSHKEIITLFARATNPLLRFIIASRPELVIREMFSVQSVQEQTETLALDDTYESDIDIYVLLKDKFNEIKTTHMLRRSIPNTWPRENDIHTLVSRASGQFVYADIVIKYVDSPRHNPVVRLDAVLQVCLATEQVDDMPFDQLDALYHQILGSVADLPKVMRILYCLTFITSICLDDKVIDLILGLSEGETRIALCDMHSLLYIPDGDETMDISDFSGFDVVHKYSDHARVITDYNLRSWRRIRFHHSSLGDFLFDSRRSKHLYKDPAKASASIAACFLRRYDEIVPHCFGAWHFWDQVQLMLSKVALDQDLLDALQDIDIFGKIGIDNFYNDGTSTPRSSDLVRGLDAFYSWTVGVQGVGARFHKFTTKLYDRLVDDLDYWLKHVIEKGILHPEQNCIMLLVCVAKVDLSAIDMLKFINYYDFRGTWQDPKLGFFQALTTVINDPSRQTYQMLKTLGVPNHPECILTRCYIKRVMHLWSRSADGEVYLDFNSVFFHWATSLVFLIPLNESEPSTLGHQLLALMQRLPDKQPENARIHHPYIQPHSCPLRNHATKKCTTEICAHVRNNAINAIKKQLHTLAIVVLSYLQKCDIPIVKHMHKPDHVLCFICQSNDAFLDDNDDYFCRNIIFSNS